MAKQLRADRIGPHRVAFDKNKTILLATENVCAICGLEVDKKLKPPHPMSPAIDHIIPVSKGGHPSAIDNLQLTHRACNREKSDKIFGEKIGNRQLPLSQDWTAYKC